MKEKKSLQIKFMYKFYSMFLFELKFDKIEPKQIKNKST